MFGSVNLILRLSLGTRSCVRRPGCKAMLLMLSSLVSLFFIPAQVYPRVHQVSFSMEVPGLGMKLGIHGSIWIHATMLTGNREKATMILCRAHAMHRGVESMVGTCVGNSSGENTRYK